MKIGSPDIPRLPGRPAPGAATPSGLMPAGMQVPLAGLSAESRSRAIGAGSAAPVDNQRVERLRQDIAAGTYACDPDRIAEALIAADLFARVS